MRKRTASQTAATVQLSKVENALDLRAVAAGLGAICGTTECRSRHSAWTVLFSYPRF